jgi:hypothetical protein
LAALERRKGVLELVARVNQLEREADRMHQDAIVALFDEERDPIVVIKWKEILDFLEAPPIGARTSATASKASSSNTPDRMDQTLLAVIVLIAVALTFDYINGFTTRPTRSPRRVDARAVAGRSGDLGGLLQLRRRVRVRHGGGQTVGKAPSTSTIVTLPVIFGG